MRPRACHPAAPTKAASAACCAPTNWSASRPIATTATSRSIGRFGGMHPAHRRRRDRGDRAGGRLGRQDPATDLLTINGEFTASIVVVRCQRPRPAHCAGKSVLTWALAGHHRRGSHGRPTIRSLSTTTCCPDRHDRAASSACGGQRYSARCIPLRHAGSPLRSGSAS